MHFIASLAVAATAAVVAASPIEGQQKTVQLPVTRVSNTKSMSAMVAAGQARLNKINNVKPVGREDVSSGSITNEDVSYIAPVVIGGYTYQLIVDTGSSNTWCGAQNACEPTNSGRDTGGSVQVSYGSGSFSGEEYIDKVSFGGATVTSQSIGAATQASGFNGVDGIIGFGPVDLTQGTVSNANTVPTFMDNLKKQGTISTEVLGVSFRPESGSDTDYTNGELTLGGTDSSKYSGSLTYVPQLTSGSAAPYWGVSIAEFSYGSTNLGSGTGIVDTGTTLLYIPSTVYSKFLSSSGGKTDSSTGLVRYTTKPTQNFGYKLGSTTFNLTPAQYLVPSAQYSYYGLTSGYYYAWFVNGGSSGVNTIIGQKFIEQYYVAFDTTNARLGFAPGV